MNKAYSFLLNSKLFKNDDYVVVAVSGGPDSMALLHLLQKVREKIYINIVCAHVNHNKRSESEDEKVFVENYCKDNDIYFEYMKIEEYGDGNFHNAAREIRYNFFKDVMKKYNSNILFTAHHGDDLIETVLMRIVRGSTLKGYAGFSKVTDLGTYKIVRPLIFHTKDEILEYNNLNKISYVLDSSNDKDDYTRNRYRHVVLPFLKNEDANVHEKFLNFSELLTEYDNYFDVNVDAYYKDNVLSISMFLNEDDLSQRKIIEYILKEVYNDDLSLINSSHVNLIIELIKGNKPNVTLKLPNDIEVIKEYDALSFKNSSISFDYNMPIDKVTLLPNGKALYLEDEEKSDGNDICRLDSSEIVWPLYVRSRKDGDKIFAKGLNGSKKVKDIFIDKKIPMSDRKLWPIVVDSDENIVWIPGLKKSKYNKSKGEKCDIIIRYR